MGELYPVEQVDRIRAANCIRRIDFNQQAVEHILEGFEDDSLLVQDFAAHRIEATPAVDREAVRTILWNHLGGDDRYIAINTALDAIMALPPVKQSDDAAALQRARDRYANLAIGLEEIRDACWPGDDAVDRIRRCAARWLSGEEEDLDARMRADLAQEHALNPVVKQSDGLAERVREACAKVLTDKADQMRGTVTGDMMARIFEEQASAIRSLDITRMDSDEQA